MTDLPFAVAPAVVDPGVIGELRGAITSTDATAASQARRRSGQGIGTLAAAAEWLAETQGQWPPRRPAAARLLITGSVRAQVRTLAREVRTAVVEIAVPGAAERADSAAPAVTAGSAVADAQIDSGTDLLLLTTAAAPEPVAAGELADEVAAGVLVGLYTGAEPAALLPRGADAVDTAAWIARAERLRDLRRTAIDLRDDPDELLAAAGSPAIAVAVGVLLRAAARRVPVVVDGAGALAAALVCLDIAPRCARWFRAADTSPDPAQIQAVDGLGTRPLLEYGIRTDDGVAALLCVPLLRAVALVTADVAAAEAT